MKLQTTHSPSVLFDSRCSLLRSCLRQFISLWSVVSSVVNSARFGLKSILCLWRFASLLTGSNSNSIKGEYLYRKGCQAGIYSSTERPRCPMANCFTSMASPSKKPRQNFKICQYVGLTLFLTLFVCIEDWIFEPTGYYTDFFTAIWASLF